MPMEISPVNPRAPQQPFMNQGSNSAPQSLYPQQFSQNVYMDSLDKSKDFYVPLGQNSNGPVSRPSSDLTTVFSRDDLNKLNDTLNKMPVDTLKGLLDKSQIDYRKCLHKDGTLDYEGLRTRSALLTRTIFRLHWLRQTLLLDKSTGRHYK
jgi:hypothetical protein